MPGSTQSRLPRSCNGSVVPMSERQQLKLVRQLETSEVQGSTRRVNDSGSPQSRGRSCNGRGETPLHRAAIKGDYELVVKLLEEGADPNTTDFAGWTPLHEACNHGWYAIALALLQAGASVNARGFDDITPLHDAAINGHSKLVCLLLESGADVHSRNKRGKTPCDVAAPELRPHLFKSYSSGSDENDFDWMTWKQTTAFTKLRQTFPVLSWEAEDSTRVKLKLSQVKKKSKNSVSEDKEKPVFESIANMEEKNGKEDIYEFKSSKEATPVRGNSTSPDVDKVAPETKNEKSSESQAGGETESVLSKRTLSEMTENEENEDDVKKKKRKEGDGKEVGTTKALGSTGRAGNVRNVSGNSEKGGKVGGHPVNKNASSAAKQSAGPSAANVTEKKSPSSPKGSAAAPAAATASNNTAKTETEQEEKSNSESEKVDPGPKVPPLKIVIPQQNSAEPEQGSRNGKNNTLRHHQALPYVVSSNSNDSEKESARSRSPSPSDSFKSDEKKDPAIGMLSAEDQKGSLHHQRVLRSSHRSGPGSNGESRSSDPGLPRTNNGNGQSSTSASGTATTPSSNSNNNNSSLSTTTAENASPQSQNRSSPLPQVEANTPASTSSSTATTESSTVSQPTTNYRNSSNSSSKGNGNSSSTSNTGSEDKTSEGVSESSQTPSQPPAATPAPVELHPRKRKLKHNKEVKEPPLPQVSTERCETSATPVEVHPHDQPVKNCYQLFLDIRKQIERRRKGLFPVQPKPPQGFKDYLMNRCTYVLAGNASTRQIPSSPLPQNISSPMKDLFNEQEKERHRLRLQHVIEKEKLVLSVEQEILRVHGRAARALANQSLPFSACTILKDEEVYNFITPEQEEKDRNARSRYNGRLFLSWLQDVDDKWEKIKEAMLLRHHNEAESLHAVQKMDWEWKMKESGCCEFKSKPVILDSHVPMVHVSDDFDLLPA